MGASDILKNSKSNLDNARMERDSRMNPPEYAPQQEVDFNDSFFDDDIGTGDWSMSDTLDTSSYSSEGCYSTPSTPQSTQSSVGVSPEDKFFEGVKVSAKASFDFGKSVFSSFKGLTPKFWSTYGTHTMFVGLLVSILGLVFILFGIKVGSSLGIGGLIAVAIGTLVLTFNVDKAKGVTELFEGTQDNSAQDTTSDFDNTADSSSGDFGDYDDDYDDLYDYDESDDLDADGYDFSQETVEEDPFSVFDSSDINTSSTPATAVPFDQALDTLVELDRGTYTRQYLYEAFTKVLEGYNPDFSEMKEIPESSDVFIQWEQYIREASEIVGCREDSLPDLLSLEENLLTIRLTTTRPVGFKHDLVATELAQIFAYVDGTYNPKVYATADVVGKNCIFTVFTGECAMVSLRDMYSQCKDFMLDTKNVIPVVVGMNPLGKVIKCDFKQLECVLVTGMPRSGKSWFVQALLAQMCAYNSPRELQFYICDPKEGISDFKSFVLPHVKKFVTADSDIVNMLRSVVRDLAPKRKKIIGDAGFVNIWDYKEMHPESYMPVIYVVIDEVVTLSERMDKDTKKEFQGLLTELVSQLPALGIRAILVPHVVKDDIIRKTTSQLIPCRISVCGDAEHVESTTGTKPKDFPYRLKSKGDMAVKLPVVDPNTLYLRAPVLSDSNTKNKALFSYLLEVWRRLEPDECKTEVVSSADLDEDNKRLLRELENTDIDDLDLFSL